MKDIRSISCQWIIQSKLQGRGIVYIIKVLSVVSIVAYQDHNLARINEEEIVFSHTWDWVRMRTIIIVQDVQVHGWLLE